MYVSSSFAFCYQLLNVISLGLAQSDPNEQLPQYYKNLATAESRP